MQIAHNLDTFLIVNFSVFKLCNVFMWFAGLFLPIYYDHMNQETARQCQTQLYYRLFFITGIWNVDGVAPDFLKRCSAAFNDARLFFEAGL